MWCQNLVDESIERVDDIMWKNFIKQTKAEEEKFYEMDFIVDEMLSTEVQPAVTTIGDMSLGSESTE